MKQIYGEGSLFHKIKHHTDSTFELEKEKIVLIGMNDGIMDCVRPILYNFASMVEDGFLADLGNIRLKQSEQVTQFIIELSQSGYCPLIVSADAGPFKYLIQSYLQQKKGGSLALIDEQIPVKSQGSTADRLLFPLIELQEKRNKDIRLFGIQKHLNPKEDFESLEKQSIDYYRLGQVKSAISETEPMLRDCRFVGLNGRALKASESMDRSNVNPSGLNIEQACQMMRYTGINEHIQAMCLYGWDNSYAPKPQTAYSIAQLIWYFIEGFTDQKGDYPVKRKQLSAYVVATKIKNKNLTFFKSKQSGRWWIEVPHKKGKSLLIPCSLKDYESCALGQITDRVIDCFQKYYKD